MSHKYPNGHVFYRNLHLDYPLIVRGEGVYLYDQNAKRYLDASGGAAVVNIGHGVEEVAQAIAAQAGKAAYLSGLQFTHQPVEDLAEGIARFLPFQGGKTLFLTSGSEAVEAAVKLARQFWTEKGKEGKFRVISRRPSYHGNTLGALSLSAREHYKDVFRPMLSESIKIPAPYCYRCAYGEEHPGCGVRCARALEEAITTNGEDNISAFIFEVVGGATTGAAVPPAEYFEVVRKIRGKFDILLIADEVMTGFGRTGRWLAGDHFGLCPDIIVMGKGITSGYVPLSCIAAKKELADAIHAKGRSLLHAQTYAQHPVACAAGVAAMEYIRKHELVGRSAAMGRLLMDALEPLRSHPHVGDIRGLGLFAGIEFVADKRSKTPFPRSQKYVERLVLQAMEKGILVWPNVGQADDVNGDLVLLAPPFTITDKEIHEVAEMLRDILFEMGKRD
jgi:adenosylmethionine-8-amino-7-oxononanoate aminotransferase